MVYVGCRIWLRGDGMVLVTLLFSDGTKVIPVRTGYESAAHAMGGN